MARGLPYDSVAGRGFAAAVSALMSGAAYAQSARMAEVKGPFDGFAANAEPAMRVMRKRLVSLVSFTSVGSACPPMPKSPGKPMSAPVAWVAVRDWSRRCCVSGTNLNASHVNANREFICSNPHAFTTICND